jgi:hypothetical protein
MVVPDNSRMAVPGTDTHGTFSLVYSRQKEYFEEIRKARVAFLRSKNRDQLTRSLGYILTRFIHRSGDAVKLYLFHCSYVSTFYAKLKAATSSLHVAVIKKKVRFYVERKIICPDLGDAIRLQCRRASSIWSVLSAIIDSKFSDYRPYFLTMHRIWRQAIIKSGDYYAKKSVCYSNGVTYSRAF